MKKIAIGIAVATGVLLTACTNDADVVSKNISKAADNFEVVRRIVLYNGITESYVLEVTGLCSLGNNDGPRQITVTCKVGNGYVKHFLGLSDNTIVFAEQLEGIDVSKNFYRVTFKPTTILPALEIR